MFLSVISKLPFLLIILLCSFGGEILCLAEDSNLFASEILHKKSNEHDGMPRENPAPVAGTADDSSSIARRTHPGSAPEEEMREAEVVSFAGLKATTLDIVLMGIVGGRHQDRRAVILTKKDRKQQMYQTGDMVEGALIKNISRGGVVLRVNGRDEVLDMSEAGNFRTKDVAGPVSVPAHAPTQVDEIDPKPESGENSDSQLPERTRIVLPVEEVVETQGDNGGS